MKKVLDKDLEKAVDVIVNESETPAADIVGLLRETQDASGVKVCTAVTITDPAYVAIKAPKPPAATSKKEEK